MMNHLKAFLCTLWKRSKTLRLSNTTTWNRQSREIKSCSSMLAPRSGVMTRHTGNLRPEYLLRGSNSMTSIVMICWLFRSTRTLSKTWNNVSVNKASGLTIVKLRILPTRSWIRSIRIAMAVLWKTFSDLSEYGWKRWSRWTSKMELQQAMIWVDDLLTFPCHNSAIFD